MKKILVLTSIALVSFGSVSITNANSHSHSKWEKHWTSMFYDNSEYWIFTKFVKTDLTEEEKSELKTILKKRKTNMPMMKKKIEDIKSGKLDKYEEFSKMSLKRKAMAEKLKTFMADKEGFEYMCMNHWDDLIAKIFVSEELAEKYKWEFEKTLKSKIEKIYAEKWKTLEKIINKFYYSSIENKKSEKFMSMIRGLELIIEDIKEDIETKSAMEEHKHDFKDVKQFIRKDLTEMQKESLVELLWERAAAQIKFKKMLSEAKEKWTLDETFEIVENKRKGCQSRFALYLDKTKEKAFKKHCDDMGKELKAMYK